MGAAGVPLNWVCLLIKRKKKRYPENRPSRHGAGQPGCAHITLSTCCQATSAHRLPVFPPRPAWSRPIKDKNTPRWMLQRWKTLVLDRDRGLVGTGPLALPQADIHPPAFTQVVGAVICPPFHVSTLDPSQRVSRHLPGMNYSPLPFIFVVSALGIREQQAGSQASSGPMHL